jgi:translation initiation factor 2 beta subunit (eIF-2beta)/eIF-5
MDNNDFNLMIDEAYFKLNELIDISITINEKLILPKIETEICSTKLYWKNIIEYLDILNRSPEHFMLFLKNELCDKEINWYSGNKLDGIIIHGKYQKNSNIVDLIKKYINAYVICTSCKKMNTELIKITLKKHNFKCLSCEMNKILNL